jgi:hypothetical protein
MGPGLGTAHTHTTYPRGPGPGATRLALASSPGRASLNGTRRTAHRGLACVAVLRALRAPRFRRERLRHHKRHQSECLTSPRNPGHARDTRRAARPGSRREPTGETERQRETVRDGSNPATSTQQRMDLLLPWRENPAAQRGRRGWRRSGLPCSREHSARVSHSPSLALLFTAPLAYTARSRRTGRSRGRNSNAEPDRARNMTIDILTTLGR